MARTASFFPYMELAQELLCAKEPALKMFYNSRNKANFLLRIRYLVNNVLYYIKV